jgi:uncharacterized protein YhaN
MGLGDKFEKDLKGIVDIEEKKRELEEKKFELKSLNLEEREKQLRNLESETKRDFKNIIGKEVEPAQWYEIFTELKRKIKRLEEEREQKKQYLASLNILPNEYLKDDPKAEFHFENFENLKNEVARSEEVRKRIDEEERNQKNLAAEIDSIRFTVQKKLKEWCKKEVEEMAWEKEISRISKERREKENELTKLETSLQNLGIDESEYIKEPTSIKYSEDRVKEVERELSETQKRYDELDKGLLTFKGKLAEYLGIEVTTGWDKIFEVLYHKRKKDEEVLQEKLAKIIAGILVHRTIEEMKKEEDEFLLESLNSEEVIKSLKALTKGKYKEFRIEGDRVMVCSDVEYYDIKDLSSGAKEVVLLSLRIGIVERLLGSDSAFMILDDAFQHVDYEKRPLVVDALLELANSGWQIFYFTMDDHIKGLFEERRGKHKNIEVIELGEGM